MTATRINRKRSHDDLDDADESLPISKRINSLHLEAQGQLIVHQQIPVPLQTNGNPFNGFGEGAAAAPNHMNQNDIGRQYHVHMCLDMVGQPPMLSILSPVPENLSNDSCGINCSDTSFSREHLHSNINHQIIESPMVCSSSDTAHQYGIFHQPVSQNPALSSLNHVQSPCLPLFQANSRSQDVSYGNPSPPDPGKCDAVITNEFDEQQIPHGPYEPELGKSENPHYFAVNRLLYEAHLSKVQRVGPF